MPPATTKLKLAKKDEDRGAKGKSTVISSQLKKQIENKEKKKKQKKRPERGVLFIKHLPHGFFEEQMKKYFEQFGKVTKLRLARSTRTGNSKGYAFVEFAVPEVAKIAAETMDNYLMFQKLVKASYIPPEEQKFNYFRTSVRKVKNPVGKTVYISGKTRRIIKKMKEQNNWTEETYKKRAKASLYKLKKLKAKYTDLGIDFDNLVAKGNENVKKSTRSAKVSKQSDEDSTHDMEESVPVKKPKISNTGECSDESNPGSLLRIRKHTSVPVKKTPSISNTSEDSDESAIGEFKPGRILRLRKPSTSSEDVSSNSINSENEENIGNETLNLKTLLGQSLNENDSSDDEYIPLNLSENSDCVSDESISEDFEDVEDESSLEEEENYVKIQKQPKLNRFEKIIQRQSHLGGVKKSKIKLLKEKAGNKFSTERNTKKMELKSKMAKEILKSGKVKCLKGEDLKKIKRK